MQKMSAVSSSEPRFREAWSVKRFDDQYVVYRLVYIWHSVGILYLSTTSIQILSIQLTSKYLAHFQILAAGPSQVTIFHTFTYCEVWEVDCLRMPHLLNIRSNRARRSTKVCRPSLAFQLPFLTRTSYSFCSCPHFCVSRFLKKNKILGRSFC